MYVRAITEGPDVLTVRSPKAPRSTATAPVVTVPSGAGGVGYPFAGEEVLQTFPHIEDQLRYVYYGTEGFNAGGHRDLRQPRSSGRPARRRRSRASCRQFGGQLTQAEIIAVVCHERYTLGGADPTSEEFAAEFETWCSPESPVFEAVESGEYDITSPEGEAFGDVEVAPVGPEPVDGSAAG